MGLKQAGFRVIGAVDIHDLSVETYQLNHPEVKVWQRDIRRLSAARVKKALNLKKGELDLLSGCPPCQGFSTMRTLNGGKRIRDSRNDLIYEFLRFVRELKPKAIMMENVPALAKDRRMAEFRRELSDLGYHHDLKILDAADYGVPQRRKRMILLASLSGGISFAEPLKERKTVRDAIGDLPKPGNSGDELHDLPEKRSRRIINLIKRIPIDGGSRSALPANWRLPCHKKCSGFKDVYGRMAWDQVAPTITSGCVNPSRGRFLHPEQDRAITIREAALLQTFPHDYFFSTGRGKYPVATLIGNALPPEFIKNHARKIASFFRCQK